MPESMLNSCSMGWQCQTCGYLNRSLTRCAKLQVVHAPGMPGTFSPQPRVSDPDMHHGTCVIHVPWCMPGALTSGFLWIRWQEKCSRHSWRMRKPQFYLARGNAHQRPWAPSFTNARVLSRRSHAITSRMLSSHYFFHNNFSLYLPDKTNA